MGLPSLLTDSNFIYLQKLLKLNAREAYGLLDYGWLLFNISHNPTYESAEHLAAILCWDGRPRDLARALVTTGFLKQDRKGRLTIADPEKRLYDWGKKRYARAQETAQPPVTERRRSAPFGHPNDPDPSSSSKSNNIKPFDLDQRRATDRDRPESAKPTGGRSPRNPPAALSELLQGANQAIQGVGVRQSRQSAPPATQPIGTYSARDCALAAASLDLKNPHDNAVGMWITRSAELSSYSGGLEFFRDLLAAVHNSKNQQLHKGTGTIHNPGAYLNEKTSKWLQKRNAS